MEEIPDDRISHRSLIPVHRVSRPDLLYDLQLLRSLEEANTQAARERRLNLPQPVSVKVGRRPVSELETTDINESCGGPVNGEVRTNIEEGTETMQFRTTVAATVLGFASVAALEVDARPGASKGQVVASELEQGRVIEKQDVAAVLENFKTYQSSRFGDRVCVVGVLRDEDGLYQSPYAYVSGASGGVVVWMRRLPYPGEFYQGRATHCLAHGDYLYVLLQVDTDSHQATNQTVVSVVKLDAASGRIVGNSEVRPEGVDRAASEWLSRREDVFRVEGDAIRVSGRYRLMDSDEIETFSTKVDL